MDIRLVVCLVSVLLSVAIFLLTLVIQSTRNNLKDLLDIVDKLSDHVSKLDDTVFHVIANKVDYEKNSKNV